MNEVNVVTVRWFDGYLESFECSEVRFGSDLLWMRLTNGQNRHIPVRQVRWFGMSKESHGPGDSRMLLENSKIVLYEGLRKKEDE